MHGIQTMRMLAGGLVSGVVFLAGGVAAHALLGSHMHVEFRSMGMGEVFARHLGLRLLFGFVTVFLYAAVRPRFGPGPATALVVAAVVYLLSYVPLLNAFDELGSMSGGYLLLAYVWGLVEVAVAALAGAWIYAEP